MRNSLLIVILAMLLAVGFSACNGDPTSAYVSYTPLAYFYHDNAQTTVSGLTIHRIYYDTIKKDSIIPRDSIILSNESVSQVYLPLLPFKNDSATHHPTCLYKFNTDKGTDTVTVFYTVSPRLYHPDFGIVYNNRIDSIHYTSHQLLDSVKLNNGTLTEANTLSLLIYFK